MGGIGAEAIKERRGAGKSRRCLAREGTPSLQTQKLRRGEFRHKGNHRRSKANALKPKLNFLFGKFVLFFHLVGHNWKIARTLRSRSAFFNGRLLFGDIIIFQIYCCQ